MACQCSLLGKNTCPDHFTAYKVRFPDGTFAGPGLGCPPGTRFGKAWAAKGHLKSAFKYYSTWSSHTKEFKYPNIDRAKKDGWVILKITAAGAQEMTVEEFFNE